VAVGMRDQRGATPRMLARRPL